MLLPPDFSPFTKWITTSCAVNGGGFTAPNPQRRMARSLLLLGIAWKIQEKAFGDLGATTKRRLAELAKALEQKGDVTRNRVTSLKPSRSAYFT